MQGSYGCFPKTHARTRGRGNLTMRISTLVICAFVIGGALALAGCGHKLVAHNGESTVAVYPDENTFIKLTDLKKQGGVVGGMIGGLGEGLADDTALFFQVG